MDGLFYTMGLDSKQFVGGLKDGLAAIKGTELGVKSLAGTMGSLKAAFGVALAGVGFFEALDKAMEREKISAAFQVILQSAPATAGFLKQLRTEAKGTGVAFDDFQVAAKGMLREGLAPTQVIESMRELKEIAVGSGVSIEALAEPLAKAREEGKLTSFVFRELRKTVEGIGMALQHVTGIPLNQIKEAADDGRISYRQLRDAISDLTTAGGRYFGATAAFAKTNLGLIAEMKRSYGEIVLQFATPTNDALKPLFQAVVDKLHEANEYVKLFMSGLSQCKTLGEGLAFIGDGIMIGLKKAYSEVVRFENGLKNVLANSDAFDFVISPTLWQAVADLATSALKVAAAAFNVALVNAVGAAVSLLPKMIRPGDDRIVAAGMAADVGVDTAKVNLNAAMKDVAKAIHTLAQSAAGDATHIKADFKAGFGAGPDAANSTREQTEIRKKISDAEDEQYQLLTEQQDALEQTNQEFEDINRSAHEYRRSASENRKLLDKITGNLKGVVQDAGGSGAKPGTDAAKTAGTGADGAPRKITSMGAQQQAVKDFLKLNETQMKRYNQGGKLSPDQAFQNFINDQSWRKDALKREGVQHTKLGIKDPDNIAEFLGKQDPSFFKGLPGRKNVQDNHLTGKTNMERILAEIRDNTKSLKDAE